MASVKGITVNEAYAIAVDILSGKVWPRALGIVAVSSVAVALQYWRKRLQQSPPPGSYGWPMIGQTIEYMADPMEFLKTRLHCFGGTFKSNLLFQPSVILAPSGENLKLMTKEETAGWPPHWVKLIGKSSMVMVNGELHVRIRKESTRAFTDDMLDKYLENEQWYVETNLSEWAARGDTAVDIFWDCKLHTFALAQQTLVGVRMSAKEVEVMTRHFTKMLDGLSAVPFDLPGFAWGKAMDGRRVILKEYKVALDKRKALLAAGEKPQCMADTILGSGMSETEILDFILTMLFAAHDTSTASMQTMLYYLKSVQGAAATETELRAEADAIWDGVSPITRQTLKSAPKIQAFIAESLRLLPPFPVIFRKLQRDVKVDGYSVPKGFTLMCSLSSICNRFAKPDEFDLRRHLDSNGDFTDRALQVESPSFGVFGMGFRHCIGHRFARDQLAMFMVVLLKKYDYRLESSKRMTFPLMTMKCFAAFVERPKGK